jgi:hypothetical protein
MLESPFAPAPSGRTVAHVTRGTMRLLAQADRPAVTEMTLASGRRADILSIGADNSIWIIETKSCLDDFRIDRKWPLYRDYCDRLYFSVDERFPRDVLPEDAGLIIADGYGAAILTEPPEHKLSAPRRRALTLQFARLAARRMMMLADPELPHGF